MKYMGWEDGSYTKDYLIVFMIVCLNLCESVWACVGVAVGGWVCILVRAYAYDVEG